VYVSDVVYRLLVLPQIRRYGPDTSYHQDYLSDERHCDDITDRKEVQSCRRVSLTWDSVIAPKTFVVESVTPTSPIKASVSQTAP